MKCKYSIIGFESTGCVPKSHLSNRFSLPMRKAQVSLPRLSRPPGELKVFLSLLIEWVLERKAAFPGINSQNHPKVRFFPS